MDEKNIKHRLFWLAAGHMFASLLLGRWLLELDPLATSRSFDRVGELCIILFACQASLLGIWIGMGTGAWWWRILCIPLGFIWYSFNSIVFYHHVTFVSPEGYAILTIIVLGLVSRVSVARIGLSEEKYPVRMPRKFQFSILQLMIITAIVAVLLASRHFISDIFRVIGWVDYDLYSNGYYLLFMYVIPSFPCVWSALGNGRPFIRISIILPCVFLAFSYLLLEGNIVYSFTHRRYVSILSWEMIYSSSLFTLSTGIVFLSLLPVRSCGYRMVRVRWERPGKEPDNPTENDDV